MNNEENMLPILYVTFEVAIALIFCIGSILNTIMVIVFFRRRGFRSHLSNRFVLCLLLLLLFSFFGQWLQKIYFEEGMLSIITQKKLFYYVERFPQINPRNTTQTFKIVGRKFLTASILYFYAIDGVEQRHLMGP